MMTLRLLSRRGSACSTTGCPPSTSARRIRTRRVREGTAPRSGLQERGDEQLGAEQLRGQEARQLQQEQGSRGEARPAGSQCPSPPRGGPPWSTPRLSGVTRPGAARYLLQGGGPGGAAARHRGAAAYTHGRGDREKRVRTCTEGKSNCEPRKELNGKVLACWCAPKMCHCNIIAQIANPPRPA